ncbi:hypothetical protein [Streptomyces californicus]|uniref:hypothetical protein n=1 Tax=Streptomyces TaxID=1883 RepID=UPI0036E2C15A
MTTVKPRLSVAVMHHPARVEAARELLRSCHGLDIELIPDPAPEAGRNALRTARAAWAATPDWATHRVLLQDDVLPVPALATLLPLVVRRAPDAIVSLYSNSLSLNGCQARTAAAAGRHWAPLVTGEYVPTLAVCLPVDRVRQFNDYLCGVPLDADGDDDVLGEFRDALRIPGYQTVPHLVEHDDGDSLSGCAIQGPRRSACYVPDAPNSDGWLQQAPQGAHFNAPVVHFREGYTRIEFQAGVENGGASIHLDWIDACRRLGISVDTIRTAARTVLIRRPTTSADSADRQLWEQVVQNFAVACFLLGWTSEGLATSEEAEPRAGFERVRPLDEVLTVSWARTGLPQALRMSVTEQDVQWLAALGRDRLSQGRVRYRRRRLPTM